MNFIGLLEGHPEGLLVLYSDDLGHCVSEECIVVVLLVEMKDLRDELPFLELQSVNLVIQVVNENSCAVGLVALVYKRNSDDIMALLVRNLELRRWGEDDGSDWVVSEEYVMASDCIVEVLSDDRGSIVMKHDSLAVFFVAAHTAHVDSIVVMAKVFIVVCIFAWWNPDVFENLSLGEFGHYLGLGRRKPPLHILLGLSI